MSRDRTCSLLLPFRRRSVLRVAGLACLLVCAPGARVAAQSPAMIRLDQVGFMCANGDSAVQFVELGAIHEVEVDARPRLEPGIYLVRIRSAGRTAALRFTVVR